MKTPVSLTLVIIFLIGFTQTVLPAGPIHNPKISWKFQTDAPVRGAVAIQNDLLLFGNSEGMIYCLNKNSGQLIWSYKTDGGISSQPAIHGSIAVFSGRSKYIYALNTITGKLAWKFEMQSFAPHKWGWDFYASSPVISGDKVFVGSGDQHLYALNLSNGQPIWNFKTGNKIRAKPRLDKDNLYVPSFDGFIYVLNPSTGVLKWKFETDGVKFDSDKSGWDRCSINSYPALKDSMIVFGSRDGNIYCVNTISHIAKWKFSHGPSWCLASPAIDGDMAFVGWSDAMLFDAIDMNTGKERWKYDLKSVSFSSPVTDKENVYVGAGNGKLYAFDKSSGKVDWEYKTTGSVFASPVLDNGNLYFGSDDGALYAMQDGEKTYRAVFQEEKFKSKFIQDVMAVDSQLGTYFVNKGYERLDSAGLFRFLTDRIQDKAASVIIFGQEYIPGNILAPDPRNSMIRKYMEAGGKIVWTGQTINWIKLNEQGDPTGNNNTAYANELLEMNFDIPDESGLYFATATNAGLKWGLPKTLNCNFAMVADKNITALAYNEFGRPTAWFRHFGERQQSGFVNIRTWGYLGMSMSQKDLDLLRVVAEYGLQ